MSILLIFQILRRKELCVEGGMSDQSMLVRRLGVPIYMSRGWIKFLGVLSIIQGIVAVFSIVGLLIAWLPIWIGIVLYQSATIMERAHLTGNEVEFVRSMDKLRLYFVIQGILALLGIIIMIFALSLGALGVILDAIQ